MAFFTASIVSKILAFLLASSCLALHDCPMPRCDECLPAEVHDAPGIGFDLTPFYGTSAVHHYDGPIQSLAKIPANAEYEELMRRLATAPKPPPRTRFQSLQRRLNKSLGWPATASVAILSNLILSLKQASEAKLSQPISHVAVTTLNFPALTQEDINDALEHTGLQTWLPPEILYPNRISEASAAFTVNGNGLCKNHQDLHDCWDEGEEMPRHHVLSVTFTERLLYVTSESMAMAFERFKDNPGRDLIDFDAGLGSFESYVTPSGFWKHVRERIVWFAKETTNGGKRPITKVLLLGESVGHPGFRIALRDALSEISMLGTEMHGRGKCVEPNIEVESMADPIYAAAWGMATYARRRQEVPRNCKESNDCEKKRREENGGKARLEL